MKTSNWRHRLETYTAGKQAMSPRRVTVSVDVYQRAFTHIVQPIRSTTEVTIARVVSGTSGEAYQTELWVDDSRLYPTFPFVWKCDCEWGRERFYPCSHVVALAFHRERVYPLDPLEALDLVPA